MLDTFFFVCILLSACVISSGESEHKISKDEDGIFVPTREWQVVRKGQPIPKGLHVRINFETGITEAKLPESNKKKETSALVEIRDQQDSQEAPNSKYMLQEELIEALQNIKNDDTIEINPEEIKKIKDKFRSYDEIKNELSDLKLNAKTDAEIIKELVNKHAELLNSKEKVNIDEIMFVLQDLEYLVHQIDNAAEFVQLNGFRELIYKNLNSTNNQIKMETLNLFGSAVQNNPKVQIHALETGSIVILTRILAADKQNNILSRSIFALSCLLHRFPLAQKQFIENGGLNIFSNILTFNEDVKLKIKLVTLVNDLILEQQFAEKEKYKEKLRQYHFVNIKTKLKELNWCNHLIDLLINTFEVDNTDHDLIEKCLNAILTSVDSCTLTLSKKLKKSLILLREQYDVLAKEEELNDDETDGYFAHIHQLSNKILKHLVLVMTKSEL